MIVALRHTKAAAHEIRLLFLNLLQNLIAFIVTNLTLSDIGILIET